MRRWPWWIGIAACDREEDPPLVLCEPEIENIITRDAQPVDEGSEIFFEQGSQGGFHAELGGVIHMQDSNVALSVVLRDDSGEMIASSGVSPSYFALVDYDAATCAGWVTMRTFLGGSPQIDEADACTFDGLAVTAEVTAAPLPGVDGPGPVTSSLPAVIAIPGCP